MNVPGGALFRWVLETSCQAAVLALLIAAARKAFRRQLSPAWRHGLWLLLVVRLLLPAAPAAPWSIYNLAKLPGRLKATEVRRDGRPAMPAIPAMPRELPVTEAAPQPVYASEPPGVPERPAVAAPRRTGTASGSISPTRDWWQVVFYAWLLGTGIFVARLGWATLRFSRRIGRGSEVARGPLLRLLKVCQDRMGYRAPVKVIEVPGLQSPAVCGLRQKRLLLPQGALERFTEEELQCVLLHELAHLRRRDLQISWVSSLLLAIHWFNPMLWLAFSWMAADREVACDALALGTLGGRFAEPYGETILKVLGDFAPPASPPGMLALTENRRRLKERMRMIAAFKERPRRIGVAIALTIGLVLVGLTNAGRARTGDPVRPKANGTGLPAGSVPVSLTPQQVSDTEPRPPVSSVGSKPGLPRNADYQITGDQELFSVTASGTAAVQRATFTVVRAGTDWTILNEYPDSKCRAFAACVAGVPYLATWNMVDNRSEGVVLEKLQYLEDSLPEFARVVSLAFLRLKDAPDRDTSAPVPFLDAGHLALHAYLWNFKWCSIAPHLASNVHFSLDERSYERSHSGIPTDELAYISLGGLWNWDRFKATQEQGADYSVIEWTNCLGGAFPRVAEMKSDQLDGDQPFKRYHILRVRTIEMPAVSSLLPPLSPDSSVLHVIGGTNYLYQSRDGAWLAPAAVQTLGRVRRSTPGPSKPDIQALMLMGLTNVGRTRTGEPPAQPRATDLAPLPPAKSAPLAPGKAPDQRSEATAQQPMRLDAVMPSAAQLGGGWTSNGVVVSVDLLSDPHEICNEGKAWLGAAHKVVGRSGCNSYCVSRYLWQGSNWISVWGTRYERANDIGDDWAEDLDLLGKDRQPEPPPADLPKIGDEVRFHHRSGLYNSLTFRRGEFLIDVEGAGIPLLFPQLKHLAEAIDKRLATGQVADPGLLKRGSGPPRQP